MPLHLTFTDLRVLMDALAQYVDNAEERDENEPEAEEVIHARALLAYVEEQVVEATAA